MPVLISLTFFAELGKLGQRKNGIELLHRLESNRRSADQQHAVTEHVREKFSLGCGTAN
jgi:hypothetical protein